MQNESTGVWGRLDPAEFAKSNLQLTELLHPVLAAAGVGAWRLDRAANSFHFDEHLRKIYEVMPFGPLKFDEIADRIHPDDRAAWRKRFEEKTGGSIFHCRHRCILGDGSVRWFDWTGNNSAADDGSTVLGICVDVTDELLVQQKLHAEEQRFQTIAMGVPGRFGYMDRNYCVQFFSKENCKALNIRPEQVIGRHTKDVFGEAAFVKLKPTLDRSLSGKVVTFEDSRVLDDGQVCCDLVTYQPDLDARGNIRGVFTLRVDITARRQLEENLRQVSENLLRSNSDLEQFAYVASHDLKAPLRSIQVLVEWLSEDLEGYTEGDVQENLQLLSTRTARLNKLLEDLLNYSRVGRHSEPSEDIDLAMMVEEIADLQDTNNGIEVAMQGASATLKTDPSALHQVLRNLIGNAIKHHPGPHGKVSVSVTDIGAHHEISVVDDGDGIAEEFYEKIFKMFQTLKPRDEVEGSGMGLAIVKRIVRGQGGKIWIESPQSGSGAVFKFTWAKEQPNE